MTSAARSVVLTVLVGMVIAAAVVGVARYGRSDNSPVTLAQSQPSSKPRVLPGGAIEVTLPDGSVRQSAPEPAIGASRELTEDILAPASPPAWLNDPQTYKAFLRATTEYYSYRESGLQHRRRVFEWQLSSARIIFVTVLLLVGAGITLAALQFRAGATANGVAATTELNLSREGIKVSSPVLGVIILVVSLAFFYLYLVYVYPIKEIV